MGFCLSGSIHHACLNTEAQNYRKFFSLLTPPPKQRDYLKLLSTSTQFWIPTIILKFGSSPTVLFVTLLLDAHTYDSFLVTVTFSCERDSFHFGGYGLGCGFLCTTWTSPPTSLSYLVWCFKMVLEPGLLFLTPVLGLFGYDSLCLLGWLSALGSVGPALQRGCARNKFHICWFGLGRGFMNTLTFWVGCFKIFIEALLIKKKKKKSL